MTRKILSLVFALLLLVCGASQAQDQKIGVSVSHTGDDSSGVQFAYAIREAIRGSQGYRLVQSDEPGIQVRLVTINPEDNTTSSNWTVATVVLTMTNFLPLDKKDPQTWYPIYLTSHVMTVGRSRTESQARSVIASVDAAIERYRRDARR